MSTEYPSGLDHGVPTRPEIAGRRWLRFLSGYLVLWGVLAGLSELDATGRWGSSSSHRTA
jgi:hypothetical protein